MSKIWDNLFGDGITRPANVNDDSHYDAIAKSYAANLSNSMQQRIAALQNSTELKHMNAVAQQASRSAPEPKDVPALAISLDAAYDLWAAKHGYEWVNINSTNDVNRLYQHQRYAMGWTSGPAQDPPAFVADDPEPEFDWYTVARRLVHVRALENEGGYYRLVPREWCK